MIKLYTIASKQQGKLEANMSLLKFCYERNNQLGIITSYPADTINQLREHFPDSLFTIEGNVVQIKPRRKVK